MENQVWPLPKFYFVVKIADLEDASFQEVSGLDLEAQVIEYRHGNSPQFSTAQSPRVKKYGNITLKKGVFKGDNKFRDWVNKIKMNTVERQPITISLLDDERNSTMTWTLQNAWPTRITGVEMKTDGRDAVVEAIEIAHEGLTIN